MLPENTAILQPNCCNSVQGNTEKYFPKKLCFQIVYPMATRSVPNYKNSNPLAITLRISLYPSNTFGERIKKWRLEQGLSQKGWLNCWE